MAWTYRLNGTAAENDETLRRGLAAYSKWSPPQSTTYHQFVGRVDGGGGFAVVETDNPADLVETTSQFATILDYQIFPVLDIAEAARALQRGVEFREAVV
ncbi:MAG TPA: DUF3303 family protein [Mycobacterium sp.]|nr:DUF3303 family protein [Mycobacterium sp.]HTX94783.1 DUF3303 family protein [Mycobacterium sp.]